MEQIPDAKLDNQPWTWERRRPNGNRIEKIIVPNPENYTLAFAEDGTMIAFNRVAGGLIDYFRTE